ncbi:MAG: lysozyme [Bacteroidota bacterium]
MQSVNQGYLRIRHTRVWCLLLLLVLGTGCSKGKWAIDSTYKEVVGRANIENYAVSPAGITLIKQFEGLGKKPYVCPGGALTVGYGQVIASQAAFHKRYPNGFTEKDAEDLLHNKIATVYAEDVKRLVQVPLLQREFDMLVSLNYNIGATTLSQPNNNPQKDGTARNLLASLNASCYEEAALAFPGFTKGGPAKAYYRGLLKRRMTEMFIFRDSTKMPQDLRIPLQDPDFKRLTACDSIAQYWEDSKQQQLRAEAVQLYNAYNNQLKQHYENTK